MVIFYKKWKKDNEIQLTKKQNRLKYSKDDKSSTLPRYTPMIDLLLPEGRGPKYPRVKIKSYMARSPPEENRIWSTINYLQYCY